ncbi:MAG: hypothetical protein H5U05_05085 [Candidatus Aminicenantes bacterium]|nr:hypothetical protein [Candidatus Aminicenantes bacterium]
MERRAKKGKKEAFINLWVRSSPKFKKQGEEEIVFSIFPLNLNIFLPVPAAASMYKNCLSCFFVSFNLLAISLYPRS